MVLDESDKKAAAANVPMVEEDDDESTHDSPETIERYAAILSETKVNVGTIFLRH